MTNPTKTQRILSILVTLGLLLQTLVPTLVMRPQTAVAAQSNTATSSGPLNNDHSAQPDSLSQPLTIARVQSTYQARETAVITYTIRNNQVAKSYPELEAGLTVTDTIAALSDFDPQIDPHTIHNLVVNAELDGATLLDASHWPISSEDQHHFHLGPLLPLADTAILLEAAAIGDHPLALFAFCTTI